MPEVLRPDPTVLVVDDEEGIHALFDRVLSAAGYTVAHARTLDEAKALIGRVPVAAVILDLTLRGRESGIDLLVWLRTLRPHVDTPVLIQTGHILLTEEAEQAIRRERAYVFYKGTRVAQIVEHLGAILRKGHDGR
jgi:DNA-binding response OmpR family regulator